MTAPDQATDDYGFTTAELADVVASEVIDETGDDLVSDAGLGASREHPQLVFGSVVKFVAELLAPTYRRKVDGRSLTWCPQWPRHPEAAVRLEALWRSWEHLRLDPALGMSIWLRDHLDHHYPILLDPHGPSRGCSPERRHLSPDDHP